MQSVKERTSKLLKLAVAAVLALMLLVCAGVLKPAKAYAEPDAVRNVANSVLKFNWKYDGETFSRGSCFLISDNTVITAYHCTFFSDNELQYYGYDGESKQELRDHMTYSVSVKRDVEIEATMKNYSEEMDFAILELSQPITGRTAVTIRESASVQAAESVYSVGYPANSDLKTINDYTASDATFKSGVVSKPEGQFSGLSTTDGFEYNGYFIQTDCKLSGGDSGGPMVDESGNVVGISVAGNEDYYLAVAIDQVTEVLDMLGIEYTKSGATATVDAKSAADASAEPKVDLSALSAAIKQAEGLDESTYTADSFNAVKTALAAAKDAESSEDQTVVDEAAKALTDAIGGLKEASSLPIIPIVIGAVVVIAIIVVVVVVMSRKKKNNQGAAAQPQLTGMEPQANLGAGSAAQFVNPASAPSASSAGFSSQASAPASEDAGATTVLAGMGDGETMVFSQAANGGTLVREKNGENVAINLAEFTVGRERSKVDYCIAGNSSISRIHVRFVVRDGKTFLVDNKAANGTYVNGVKTRPGQEVQLKDGDKITLADEKFTYKK